MEGLHKEFKRELCDEIEKEAVAFLNTSGGELLIGVSDDGSIWGVDNIDKTSLALIDRLKHNICPSITGLFAPEKRVCPISGKSYLSVKITAGLERPYYLRKYGLTPKGCYQRIDSQSAQMTQPDIDKMFMRKSRNTLHNAVAPRQDLTFGQLKIFYNQKGFDTDNEFLLRNLEFFTEDGRFNYAAYLMADNNANSFRVIRYSGADKTMILSQREYGYCCLVKSARGILSELERHNSKHAVDKTALREAALNAVIHNDYTQGACPTFAIFDDRIEIASVGGLPLGLSEDEFFDGRSLPRNREIMRIFRELDFGGQSGTSGMQRIMKVYSRAAFDISSNFVNITLRPDTANDTVKARHDAVNDTANDTLSDGDFAAEVLRALRLDSRLSAQRLADVTGKSVSTVKRALKRLKSGNIIERIGSDKNGYWKIAGKKKN